MLRAIVLLSLAVPAAAQQATLIRGARIFDGRKVIERADVLIDRGRIAAVRANVKAPPGARRVDANGMTLLPGLIDAHTHATSRFTSQQALAFGVTTEIDLLCQPSLCAPMQREQLRGSVTDRADVLSAMISVTAPGGHGTEYFAVPALSSADSAQAFVDARIAEGAQWIKIIYTVPGGRFPALDPATIRAAIAAAHKRGKLAVVHIDALENAREVIDAGADGLAHSFADRDPDPEFGRFMAAHRAFMIPTLSVRMGGADPAFYVSMSKDSALSPFLTETARASIASGARWRPAKYSAAEAAIRQMRDAGALVLAGTDAPNPGTSHGASMHGELELLVRAGLTPVEALRAATSSPAAAFRLKDRGVIADGMRADLILVRGDPTRDIRATRRIVSIWKAGVPFDRGTFRVK